MEEISPIIVPNTAMATYVGFWLKRKHRTWTEALGASTLPFVLIIILMIFYYYFRAQIPVKTIFLLVLLYWFGYLAIAWSIPFVYFLNRFDILRLKRAAIKNLGWIAGNASGVPFWQARAGESSEYYKALMYSDDQEAGLRAELYNTWLKQGQKEAYNEKKCEKLYKTAGRKVKKADSYRKWS